MKYIVIIEDENNEPIAFMGVEDKKLEMLFVKNSERDQKLGKQLLTYGIDNYNVNELTVNEQNPSRGFSIAVQGVLQSLGCAIKPLIISLLRLVIFVFPIAYLFTLSDNVTNVVWCTVPIAEVLTCIISVCILIKTYTEKIKCWQERYINPCKVIKN